ncbi:GntR family transcriptional regulator [Microbaculum marinum]|uniref:GntR family transcriptional regulator n=1 Tax=Microbaculum marinum TaxID=1764581 RepID=A0AAW9RTM5_9HYPH
MSASADRDEERSPSQTVRAQLALRDLILGGELRPGDRISELPMVDRLGVSRTPVRLALVRLEEEGLLEAIPSGGFAVRSFSERDVFDAIEVRGALEGLAARLAAERGVPADDLLPIRDCLAELDAVVEQSHAGTDAFPAYVELNARFHRLLLDLADSPSVARQVERAATLPFASPSAFVKVQAELPEARTVLTVAQDHHRCVIDAIEGREGTRAEAIMREHARLASRNLRFALRNKAAFELIPGAALLRRRGRT